MTLSQALAIPERRVGGRCELFLPFARGGMASIYIGRWADADGWSRVVAVKTLLPQLAADARLSAMFQDEAKLVSQIRHPNVLAPIDVVQEGGELFMVMDYVHGATLSQLMRAGARHERYIPLSIAMRIMVDVLQGLHAAHEATDERGQSLQMIHRDVSPQNVLIGVDGRSRLIDFGVAKALNRVSTTRTGEIKGKLCYFAPEQLLGDPLSRRTDVYGASVVMWQLLTGQKLFEGRNLAEVTHDILRATIEPPSRFRYGVTRELDAIVMRGLSRDPSARWESAEAMACAIDGLRRTSIHGEVGDWVQCIDKSRLDELAQLVAAIENAPFLPAVSLARHVPPPLRPSSRPTVPSPPRRPPAPTPPPPSRRAPRRLPPPPASTRLPPVRRPLFSAVPVFDEDPLHVPTRTQLTSQADLTPASATPAKLNHLSTWLMFATVLGTVVATLWRSQPLPLPDHATAAPAQPTAARPLPLPPPAAPPTLPVTAVGVAPSASASTAPEADTEPPRETQQPRSRGQETGDDLSPRKSPGF